MNILEKILLEKQAEVARRKAAVPLTVLQAQEDYHRTVYSLKEFLLDEQRNGIIAEFKRKSPSKGNINGQADVVAVTQAYATNGAAGISVLTDELFFGGSTADLQKARINEIPILRKDFMIDEYQLAEAKAMGADVILLIAACLSPARVQELAKEARRLGLEVLLELHDASELQYICDETELVGINNRNLKTFEVDIARSLQLAEKIPADKIKIAESGIDKVENILTFKQAGYKGFLIGENFMKVKDPGKAFKEFTKQLKEAIHS